MSRWHHACIRKDFKTDAQRQQHYSSKLHKKKVQDQAKAEKLDKKKNSKKSNLKAPPDNVEQTGTEILLVEESNSTVIAEKLTPSAVAIESDILPVISVSVTSTSNISESEDEVDLLAKVTHGRFNLNELRSPSSSDSESEVCEEEAAENTKVEKNLKTQKKNSKKKKKKPLKLVVSESSL